MTAQDTPERRSDGRFSSSDPIRVVESIGGGADPIVGGTVPAWLLRDGRDLPSDAALFGLLCRRLLGAGISLWRATLHAGTIHPQLRGLGWRWRRAPARTESFVIDMDANDSAEFRDSPIYRPVVEGCEARFRLHDGDGGAYELLRRLQAEGVTDYLVLPLSRITNHFPVVTWASDAEAGFSDREVSLLRELAPALAAVIELRMRRRMERDLLATYLGRLAGPRILAGEIRRGACARLEAAIMATDLRGFTRFSDTHADGEIIALLDAFFDLLSAAVTEFGGDVLKFMGDGALAVFPIDGDDRAAPAVAALAAATRILERLGKLTEAFAPGPAAGIGLHVGEVIYGNVGAEDRLDFTVIGPAVNRTFRIEAATKTLGQPLLASEAFAWLLPGRLVPAGRIALPGFAAEEMLYAPP